MKYTSIFILLGLLSGCASFPLYESQIVGEDKQTVTKGMIINGWVTSDKYWSNHESSLVITVYMMFSGKYLPVSKQIYSSRLPVRYSSNISPVQAGDGPLVVAVQLKIKNKPVALARQIIKFEPGSHEVDLPLIEL